MSNSSFRKTIPAYRMGAVSTVDGYKQQSAETAFTVEASVQPLRPSEMDMLPEGRRNSKAFRLYSSDELNIVGTVNPDQVELFGERYEIIGYGPWQNNVIDHYKYIAMIVLEN